MLAFSDVPIELTLQYLMHARVGITPYIFHGREALILARSCVAASHSFHAGTTICSSSSTKSLNDEVGGSCLSMQVVHL
jgi:hypothetical protein